MLLIYEHFFISFSFIYSKFKSKFTWFLEKKMSLLKIHSLLLQRNSVTPSGSKFVRMIFLEPCRYMFAKIKGNSHKNTEKHILFEKVITLIG